jgi:hypothetical protein
MCSVADAIISDDVQGRIAFCKDAALLLAVPKLLVSLANAMLHIN